MDKPITTCDICEKEFYQEDLINIDPNFMFWEEFHNLKMEYREFDGMVCEDCYTTMEVENVKD